MKCRTPLRSEAAHISKGNDRGVGIKTSDIYTLPLCAQHHREQHSKGEVTFWNGNHELASELAEKLQLFVDLNDKVSAIGLILKYRMEIFDE